MPWRLLDPLETAQISVCALRGDLDRAAPVRQLLPPFPVLCDSNRHLAELVAIWGAAPVHSRDHPRQIRES